KDLQWRRRAAGSGPNSVQRERLSEQIIPEIGLHQESHDHTVVAHGLRGFHRFSPRNPTDPRLKFNGMLKAVVLAILLFVQKPEFASLAGNVVAPEKTTIRQSLQVVIMPEPYR